MESTHLKKENRLNPTELFLLACVRANSDDELRTVASDCCRNSYRIDWFFLLKDNFKVFLPFYLQLKMLCDHFTVPSDVAQMINQRYLHTAMSNEQKKKEVIALAREFKKNEIDILFIKGSALLFTVYAYDIGLRTMADIDVLFRKKDFVNAESLLCRIGYREDYEKLSQMHKGTFTRDYFIKQHYHTVYFKNEIQLEAHWNIGHKVSPSLLDKMFQECTLSTAGDAKIKAFKPHAQIFHAYLNFMDSYDWGVDWVSTRAKKSQIIADMNFLFYEIKMMIKYYKESVSWDDFILFVKLANQEYAVYSLIMLGRKVANSFLPESVANEVRGNLFVRFYLFLARHTNPNDAFKLFLIRKICQNIQNYRQFMKKPVVLFRKLINDLIIYLSLMHPGLYCFIKKVFARDRLPVKTAKKC